MKVKDAENYILIASLFEEAQPQVPNTISAQEIEDKIISKQKHRRIKFEQKRSIKPFITAAACFALIIGVLFFFNPLSHNANKVQNFKSEQELNSVISALSDGSSSELGAGSSFFSQSIYSENDLKNLQGRIAANENYIFYAYYDSYSDTNRNRIYIFNKDKENPKLIYCFNSFTNDSKCISSISVYENNLAISIANELNVSTTTKIYDISNPKTPALITEFEQSGGNAKVYSINDTLYITSFFGTAHDNIEGVTPKSENDSVKPENIYRFDNAQYNNYAVIGTINIKTCKRAKDTKAVLGAYCEYNFTDESLYLTDGNYENPKYIKYNLKTGTAEYAEIEKININEAPLLIKQNNNTALSLKECENATEASLYDISDKSKPKLLDNKILNGIYGNYNHPAVTSKNSCIFTCYSADEQRRYYGAVQLKTENNKIITKEYMADSDRIMEADICIAADDYIYTIYQPDTDSAEIYSFGYR